jgi:hypothetical protein
MVELRRELSRQVLLTLWAPYWVGYLSEAYHGMLYYVKCPPGENWILLNRCALLLLPGAAAH